MRTLSNILRLSSRVAILAVLVFSPVQTVMAASDDDVKSAAQDFPYYDKTIDVTSNGSTCTQASASGPVSASFSLGSSAAERQATLVKQLMSTYRLTAEQASGPVGNFMWESGGKDLPPDHNEGAGAGPPAFSGGYGWAQWTGGRQVAFIDYAIKNGYMKSKSEHATDGANYAYLTHELDVSYKETITELKKQSTPESAALSFEATFERANPAYAHLSDRKKNAREAFNAYKSQSGGATTSGSSSGCGSDVAVLGNYAFPLAGHKSVVKNPGIFHDGTTDQGGHPYIAYDIYANKGTEVVAFTSGKVTYESIDRCNVKFLTIWNQELKLGITYMHLSDHIGMGKTVQPGDHVGTVGQGSGDPGCEIQHLHIDASTDRVRQACSRTGCTIQDHFRPIGKELYQTYQALPE